MQPFAQATPDEVLADAEAEGRRIISDARTQAYFEAGRIREEGVRQARATMIRVLPTTSPIHSSEITLREFPRAWRGFDRDAVSKWLALVEQAYTLVEDELERRRVDFEQLVTELATMRRHTARASATGGVARVNDETRQANVAWDRVVETAAAAVPATRIGFDTLLIRTALMEHPLRRSFAGYSRDQVTRLLEQSAGQLARLENQLRLAYSENDRLLALLLQQAGDAASAESGVEDNASAGSIHALVPSRPND